MSDPALLKGWRDEEERSKTCPRDVATPQKVRLVLSRFYYLGVEFLQASSTVGPWYISGELFLNDVISAVRIDVDYNARGRIRTFPNGLNLLSLRRIYDCARVCADTKSSAHTNCPKSKENPAPLRLVEVMSGDTLRLVETQSSSLKYAALSYCWGSCKAAGTRTSNVAERMVSFKLGILPQTLQDSIVIAHALKIRYIWIDRLCIVQGCGEWAMEAGKMMSYYANSYLTIVPVACSSAEESFLGQRQQWVSERMTGFWVGKPEREFQFNHPHWEHVETEVDRSAWNERAWTFQERLLSARSVFFGRNGIRFECRGAAFEEYNFHDPAQQNPEVFLPSPNTQSSEWDSLEKVRGKWYNMVTQYVERHLAFETDRLIALAGVAERFGILFGDQDEYLSGFFKNDLSHALCWRFWKGYSRSLEEGISLTKSSSFPSWSWCCMKRPITWTDGTGSIPCAQLLEAVKSTPDKCDPAVQGETVKLVLEAWAFPAAAVGQSVPDALEFNVRLDTEEEPTEDLSVLGGDMAVVLSAYLPDGMDEQQWRGSKATMLHEVYGLIVRKAGSQHQGIEEYTREGIFEIVCEHLDADVGEDSKQVTELFYQQIYASRCAVALI
ncbi:hypothetical protein LTR96_003903 [Exophiala xenobiotica]|nr:hypothetical protein LTR96_003903 [Exophiala xenobiotica]KAK5339517.1 hypothetical protein LTR98_004318 [Exophiala xenobiotica]